MRGGGGYFKAAHKSGEWKERTGSGMAIVPFQNKDDADAYGTKIIEFPSITLLRSRLVQLGVKESVPACPRCSTMCNHESIFIYTVKKNHRGSASTLNLLQMIEPPISSMLFARLRARGKGDLLHFSPELNFLCRWNLIWRFDDLERFNSAGKIGVAAPSFIPFGQH